MADIMTDFRKGLSAIGGMKILKCTDYAKGIDGLIDRRGRSKPVEDMTEIERLQAENRILKAQLERKELENIFLKKVDEIERRRS